MTQTSKGFIVRAYHFIYKSLVCYSLFEISVEPHTVPALSQGPEPQRVCWMGGWGCSESCDTFLGVFTCQQLAPWSRGWLFCQFIFRLSVWRIYLTSAQPITDLHTHSWPDSGARPHMPAPGWEPCGVACGRTSPAVMATLRGTAGASIFGAAR